jgi:pimeloyl-ACP methyl ester carboxylesterase
MAIPQFQSHFVQANGIRMHYVSIGQGKPLVLLHGWPEFWRTWHKLMSRLAEEYMLVAPDLRGLGDTEKPYAGPSDQNTPEVMAEDLRALADALGLARFGLVSHDVGSFVAQSFARAHASRLSGLFFFNCAYPGIGARWSAPDQLGEIWYQSFNQQDWAAQLVGHSRDTCRLYIGHILRHWSHRPDTFDGELELWIDNFMKPGNLQGGFNWHRSIHRGRIAAMKGEAPKLPPIGVPSYFLWGAREKLLKLQWTDRLVE